MSQEFLEATLDLVKQCSLLHRVQHSKSQGKERTELSSNTSVKPIPNYDSTNLINEHKQVKIFAKLQNSINQALLKSTDASVGLRRSPKNNLDTFKKLNDALSLYATDPSVSANDELIKYLEFLLEIIKPKVEETTLMISAITRSVHRVEGVSSKEKSIKDLIRRRDQLILDVLQKEKEANRWNKDTQRLRKENSELLKEIKLLVNNQVKREARKSQSKEHCKENEELDKLEQDLKNIINKNMDLGDSIQSLIVRSGVNWGEDEGLRDIVLRSGEVNEQDNEFELNL